MIRLMENESIDHFISHQGSKEVKIISLVILLLPIILIFKYKNNKYILVYMSLIIVSLIAYKRICDNCYKSREFIDFKDFYHNARSGDIILFKTYSSYDIPEFIYYRMFPTLTTQSDWSHVGMLVRCPFSGRLYIYESSETPTYDYMTKSMFSGIKFTNVVDKVKNYDGFTGYRRLKTPLNSKQSKQLYDLCLKNKNTPFRQSMINDNGINCAEAVSAILKVAGIYNVTNPFSKMVPCTFSSSCNLESNKYWDDDKIIKF